MIVDNSINSPYIFWLFDCGPEPIARRLRITPRYVRCDISSDGILLHESPKQIHIPFAAIQECELYQIPGLGDGVGFNLRIQFVSPTTDDGTRTQTTELFLLPANVLKHYEDGDDRKTMLTLIQALRSGQATPDVEKNPYHRRLLRQYRPDRIAERVWDPTLPPSHYSPAPTVKRVLVTIVLTIIGVSIAGSVVIAIIYYLVTGHLIIQR